MVGVILRAWTGERSCVMSGVDDVLRVCGAVSSSGTGGACFRSWSLKRCWSLVSHCHALFPAGASATRSVVSAAFAQTAASLRSASGVLVAKFSVSVSNVSAQQLYISKETSRIRSMLSDGNVFSVAAEPVCGRGLCSVRLPRRGVLQCTPQAL